jgi:uncharacterized protein YggE
LATQYALDDVNVLTNTAGVRLKKVFKVSKEHGQQFPMPIMLTRQADAYQDEGIIEPGRVEIRATVNMAFEIE